MKLSVVIPGYNESRSLPYLIEALDRVLSTLTGPCEVIFVDDGSRDDTPIVLQELIPKYPYLKAIRLARNYGQTMAIWVGVQEAQGEIIVLMDADLENDPADIPRLLDKMAEGYDVVSGWRKDRWKGQWLTRRLPSLIANKLISWLSGVHLHDYGCTLKAYRRKVIAPIRLYGRMHRFIPIYAKWEGGRITEIPVHYQPRRFGKSNYGMMRIVSVFLDLIVILFLDKYLQRPMQFFGGLGLVSILLGLITFLWALYYKIFNLKDFVQTPLPIFTVLFISIGVLMVLMGVMAELLIRIYYESTQRTPVQIRDKITSDSYARTHSV